MDETRTTALIRGLERDAMAAGAPAAIAQTAGRATRRRMSGEQPSRRRVASYFWTVVRNNAVRCAEAVDLTQRYVLRAVVADLKSCGAADDRIRAELERGWRGEVADEVLDSITRELCA